MRLALSSLAGLLLALGLAPHAFTAAPPAPPPEFAQPQSPPKPAPFRVNLVDQGQFDPRFKGYFLPEGFRMEVVLSEPDVVNPVGMTFAPDGTLFVLEWRPDPVNPGWNEVKETFRYRDGSTRQVATMKKFTTDLVKQFNPNPATGKFGPPKPIIADELPSSILYHDGWLYLTGRGTVRRYRQARVGSFVGDNTGAAPKPSPNDPWSVREIIAQGFCGFHHHQVSGLSIGNDGWLYLTSGDDDNFVEGSDGSRATVLRTGAVFRCRPDGSKMETFSLGYRNPYRDIAHDDRFNWFHADNDNEDGSKFTGCRLMHVTEGVDYGWRLRVGARCCRPDHTRASVGGEVPGRLPPMLKTGRGSPAGLLIYHDTRLPEHYRGLQFYPDVFRKLVRAYKVAPDEATFKVTGELEFMKSDDPLFRPCQMVTGPDGAVYVCDWRTDSGGAGKLWGDGVHGRIYRITWAGTDEHPKLPLRGLDSWAKILSQTDEQLVATLGAPDLTDRVESRKELVRRGEKSRDLVLRKFADLPDEARLPALGVMQAHWDDRVEELFRKLLTDSSADVRRLAADALGMNARPKDQRAFEALLKTFADVDPAVRRAGAIAIGRLGTDGAGDALVAAWRADHTADPFLRDAYIRGIERLGKPGIDALLSLALSGDRDKDAAVEAFITLRTKPAADALPELLNHPHVTAAQREALVRSYENYQLDPPLSLEPLADYLLRRPDEKPAVVLAAVEVVSAGGYTTDPKVARLALTLLERKETEVRQAVIKMVEEMRLIAAGSALLEIIADADRPSPERAAAVKAARVMNDPKAAAAVRALLAGPAPPALKTEALRTLGELAPDAARTAAEGLLAAADPGLLKEAVAVLGTTKPGAKLVGERYLAHQLPRDLFPQVTEALRKFAGDPALDKLRADVMKGGLLVSLEPSQILKTKFLVARGDPKKGKELYLNTKLLACASCHKMEGVGGSVGPDLTRVWDTHTIEKLLESIVEPSKEIKEGYQTWRAVTAKGQTVTGLKVSETAKDVVLRDANGRDVRIDKEDVEQLSPTKLSLMPEDAVARLSYEQFIDLLAFLKSRKEQESLRGLVVEYRLAAGPFPADVRSSTPEVSLDASAKGTDWKPLPAEAGGVADLKAAFPAAGAAGVYARAFVYSPAAQTVTGVVQAEDPVRVWVGSASVFDRATPNLPGSTAEETFKANLKAGWNVVLVKVANTGRSHRLGLRFTGDGLRTAPEPEGAGGQ
jgi:putative membrane-bound dehydrogenase-like protein